MLSLLWPRFDPCSETPTSHVLWPKNKQNHQRYNIGTSLERVIYSTLRIAFEYFFK